MQKGGGSIPDSGTDQCILVCTGSNPSRGSYELQRNRLHYVDWSSRGGQGGMCFLAVGYRMATTPNSLLTILLMAGGAYFVIYSVAARAEYTDQN